jgi:RNA polymerase sigma-70 factor (ECF subfamily)
MANSARQAGAGDEPLDIELWLAYRDGDASAFTELYRRHAPAVLRYAWSMLRDQAAAEEVLQETFLTAWDRRRSSRTIDDSLLPWILVVCRNHSRNALRRVAKHRSIALHSLPEQSGAATAQHPAGELDWIADELARLSPQDQQLCQLCLVEGYTYSEAARILDTTQAAVGKRLQRARARLAAASGTNE